MLRNCSREYCFADKEQKLRGTAKYFAQSVHDSLPSIFVVRNAIVSCEKATVETIKTQTSLQVSRHQTQRRERNSPVGRAF